MTFRWYDDQGQFFRSYSIARQDGNRYTFLIKIKPSGRGSSILSVLSAGDIISVTGIHGQFHLQDSDQDKVFIATGTGLAPIYALLMSLPRETPKVLYFSVSKKEDLFYEQELRKIDNLTLHIHLTQEKVDGYNHGRVHVGDISAQDDTEWYLCGNPLMIETARKHLQEQGFTRIYQEKF